MSAGCSDKPPGPKHVSGLKVGVFTSAGLLWRALSPKHSPRAQSWCFYVGGLRGLQRLTREIGRILLSFFPFLLIFICFITVYLYNSLLFLYCSLLSLRLFSTVLSTVPLLSLRCPPAVPPLSLYCLWRCMRRTRAGQRRDSRGTVEGQ